MNTTDEQIKTLQDPCKSDQWYCNGEWHVYNDWKASRERCPKPDLLTAILAELRESRELLEAAVSVGFQDYFLIRISPETWVSHSDDEANNGVQFDSALDAFAEVRKQENL